MANAIRVIVFIDVRCGNERANVNIDMDENNTHRSSNLGAFVMMAIGADRGVRGGGAGAAVGREELPLACAGSSMKFGVTIKLVQRTQATIESIRRRDARRSRREDPHNGTKCHRDRHG